ncbi:hypothetical protein SAMD00079811_78850 (plasmid) [Scytonema sp. HK-05]|nr:hypothetical protein [Scytonema sp. HK-05]BAY50256.1 hypothetical protein SAMD00079811_78850 [Scytonema sp. HK-05]
MDELERLDLNPYFSEDGETIDLHSFLTQNPSFRAKSPSTRSTSFLFTVH